MINLLSYSKKKSIRDGRINVILVRYALWIGISAVILSIIVVASLIMLNNSRQTAQNRVDDSKQQIGKYSVIENDAAAFRNDLSVAKQVFDKDITYSKLLLTIAASLPKGVYLDSLDLDASKLGTQTTLTFNTVSQDAALNLKKVLESNTRLYSDVRFTSVTIEDEGDHPVKATVSLIINKEALQ